MNKVYIVLFSCLVVVLGQNINWAQRGRVKDNVGFFSSLMQETVLELERSGFNSLRLTNITKNINERMYKWLVNGTVTYTNGFLVSIQSIDVTNVMSQVGNPTVNGRADPRASVSGNLNLRTPKLGYDVIFTPADGTTPQWYTGDYTMTWITWSFSMTKNYTTNAIVLSSRSSTSADNRVTMNYRPATNLTEVLSRHFFAYDNNNGVDSWRSVLEEIILNLLSSKVPFPPVCFGQC